MQNSHLFLDFQTFRQKFADNYKIIIGNFKNQEKDVQDFLHNKAENFDDRNIAKTFLYIHKPSFSIIGFFSLATKGLLVEQTKLSSNAIEKITGLSKKEQALRKGLIAIFYLIGQLGVATDFQNEGYGSMLFIDAIDLLCSSQDKIGIRYILIDAINQARLISFYESFNFKKISKDTEETVMMIGEIKKLRAYLA
ncbi:GNAT family N-acetyltransferase [Helicobacter brantae]|uniref:Uncharacterized protein n=1 Tax=Helicobacter brantae TaxID=375927 RepID=A0A3D8IZV2_9HELI|nr:GNAT family N-acetyltransferase [Helicobacter brantae]RDU70812.1 hypothetical protein CQA58_04635 [Helicobacter brantae]